MSLDDEDSLDREKRLCALLFSSLISFCFRRSQNIVASVDCGEEENSLRLSSTCLFVDWRERKNLFDAFLKIFEVGSCREWINPTEIDQMTLNSFRLKAIRRTRKIFLQIDVHILQDNSHTRICPASERSFTQRIDFPQSDALEDHEDSPSRSTDVSTFDSLEGLGRTHDTSLVDVHFFFQGSKVLVLLIDKEVPRDESSLGNSPSKERNEFLTSLQIDPDMSGLDQRRYFKVRQPARTIQARRVDTQIRTVLSLQYSCNITVRGSLPMEPKHQKIEVFCFHQSK
jgi:hypothetical protein